MLKKKKTLTSPRFTRRVGEELLFVKRRVRWFIEGVI